MKQAPMLLMQPHPQEIKQALQMLWILFIKANNVGQYIAENKWSKIPAVDTTLVLNIGKAALNAGKNDSALVYFQKIADAGISGTKDGGAGNAAFELPYQWLTLHYKDAKDSKST